MIFVTAVYFLFQEGIFIWLTLKMFYLCFLRFLNWIKLKMGWS